MHKIGSNRLCSISCVAILLCLKTQVCFCWSLGSVSLLPRTETSFSWMKMGCILSKGLICFSYFSAKLFSKQQVLGAHKATVLKPHPKAFPWKSSYLKWIDKLKVPFYYSVGEMYRAMYTYIHTHQIVAAVGVFSYKFWEKSQRCFSLVLCIYIKKNKVLYVFITLIIVIKSLPFLICGLGGFLFVCFPVWGFCLFFCFFWAKKNLLLVFVLLLVRTLKYWSVFKN